MGNLNNTGTISFVLYGVFISITLIALFIASYFIIKGKIPSEKLDKIIDLFKYSIVSVAIATTSLIVSDLFKERDQDVKELEYFGKYINDFKRVDNIEERLQLSKYLSIVAPSGDLKNSWQAYNEVINSEYIKYLDAIPAKAKIDSIEKPTLEQISEKEKLEKIIEQAEAPFVSYQISEIKNYEMAKNLQNQGFDLLLKKDIANAIKSFIGSENAYNGFNNVYEISRYLKKNKSTLQDEKSELWKSIYMKIASDYSAGMSKETKSAFLNNAKK